MTERKSVTRLELAKLLDDHLPRMAFHQYGQGYNADPDFDIEAYYDRVAGAIFDALPATPPASDDLFQYSKALTTRRHRMGDVDACHPGCNGPHTPSKPASETVDAAREALLRHFGDRSATIAALTDAFEAAIRAEIGADANSKIAAAYERGRAESDERVKGACFCKCYGCQSASHTEE